MGSVLKRTVLKDFRILYIRLYVYTVDDKQNLWVSSPDMCQWQYHKLTHVDLCILQLSTTV